MEEFYYPMHSFDAMDVTIPVGQDESGFIFEPIDIAIPGLNIQENCVMRLSTGGTGSIVAVPQNHITYQGKQISALLITAGHCVANVFTGKPFINTIEAVLGHKRGAGFPEYTVIHLVNFLKDHPTASRSYSSHFRYCVPNDLALCLLLGSIDKTKLSPVIIDYSKRDFGEQTIVSGHPYFTDTGYIFPAGGTENQANLIVKLKNAFHNFNRLVNSIGRVRISNQCLLETECSTTSGMSGSPVFFVSDLNAVPIYTSYRLCGVYIGGPPLFGQAMTFEIVTNHEENPDKKATIKRLKNLRIFFKYSPNISSAFKHLIDYVAKFPFNFPGIEGHAIAVAKAIVRNNEELKRLDPKLLFNVAIPTTHPVFRKVQQYCLKFTILGARDFIDINELLGEMNE